MSRYLFNTAFYNDPASSDIRVDSASFRSLYSDQDPLYFCPEGTTETQQQLSTFKTTSEFVTFKAQYMHLLAALDEWCSAQGIQKLFIPIRQGVMSEGFTPTPAFQCLGSALFESEIYDIRAAIFFNEGKKDLEELLLLLRNEYISIDEKKSVLMNLQDAIIVCGDGLITHIEDAKTELVSFTNVLSIILDSKRMILQQIAVNYINVVNDVHVDMEIHYANAYYNAVAQQFGVSLKQDQTKVEISPAELENFSIYVEEEFTPTIVIEYIILHLDTLYKNLHTRFKTVYFSDVTTIDYETYQRDYSSKIEAELQEWNAKYGVLLSLNPGAILTSNEENTGFYLTQHTSTFIKAAVSRSFRKHFLSEASQPVVLRGSVDETTLYYDNEISWIEKSGTVVSLTPELFLKIDAPSTNSQAFIVYLFVLNGLLRNFPGNIDLLGQLLPTKSQLLTLTQTASGETKSLVWLLTYHKQFHLLKRLVEKQQVSLAHPSTTEVVWLLSVNRQFTIIDLLIKQKQIATEHLMLTPTTGLYAGFNAVWLILYLYHNEVLILKELFAQGLLNQTLLASSPLVGRYEGMNIIWHLAKQNQIQLLSQLLDHQLITSDQLSATVKKTKTSIGTNALWILAFQSHFDFFDKLIAANLVTQEQLSATNEDAFRGVNVPYILAQAKQFSLLEKLLTRGLLIPTHLLPIPETTGFKGLGFVWLLATEKQYELMARLLISNYITSRQLDAPADDLPNVIWVLAVEKQYQLLSKLHDARLITQEHLGGTYQITDYEDTNALWFLASNEKWDFIDQLITASLVTKEMLSIIPACNKTIPYLLASAQQFELLDKLLMKGLLSAEPLLKIYDGISGLSILTGNNQIQLLLKMLTAGLITKEQASINADSFALAQIEEIDKTNKLIARYNLIGRTPDTLARAFRNAAANNQVDDIRFLLKLSDTILNTQDSNPSSQKTALHIATERGHVEVVAILIEAGAKMDIRTASGLTALDMAVASSSEVRRLFHIEASVMANSEKNLQTHS